MRNCIRKKWLGLRVLISMCAALGWWGLLYPELTLVPDTVKVLEADERGNLNPVPTEWVFDNDLYRKLLNAGPEKITYRSKLLTDFSLFWEALQNGNK